MQRLVGCTLMAGKSVFGTGVWFCERDELCALLSISQDVFCSGTSITKPLHHFGGAGYTPMPGLCSLQVSPPGPWMDWVGLSGHPLPLPAGRAGAQAAPSASVELPAVVGERHGALRGRAGDWVWLATAEMSWVVSAWLLHAQSEAGGLRPAGLSPFPRAHVASHRGP